jgi:hypothetical protein
MGSAIETENWQPGKVLNKTTTSHTYPTVNNYWTPLQTNKNKDEEEHEEQNHMINSTQMKINDKESNKWTRRLAKQKEQQQE